MSFQLETLDAVEQRITVRDGDSWCRSNLFALPSGLSLDVTACHFAPSFEMAVVQPPAELELVVSQGGVLLTRTEDGQSLERGGNRLQVGRTGSPAPLQLRPDGETRMTSAGVTLSAARLRELLGVAELPNELREVAESTSPISLASHDATPRLLRLLEEISNADVRGASRPLWHQAKALELVALMTDELAEAAQARSPRLSAHEIERLERVRLRLVERLEAPPTLAELARDAGFSETRLKGAFRARFGTSVFACLRELRMAEARRLLQTRRLSVTEVALRVGYENPSKFAAAFRRQHGRLPSSI